MFVGCCSLVCACLYCAVLYVGFHALVLLVVRHVLCLSFVAIVVYWLSDVCCVIFGVWCLLRVVCFYGLCILFGVRCLLLVVHCLAFGV